MSWNQSAAPHTIEDFSDVELDALIKRTALNPDAELRASLYSSWPHAKATASAVRKPRPASAEPMHIFALPVPRELI